MNENAFFRLNAVGEIPSSYAGMVLKRLEDAYCGLYVLDQLKNLTAERFRTIAPHLEINVEHSIWLPEPTF